MWDDNEMEAAAAGAFEQRRIKNGWELATSQ